MDIKSYEIHKTPLGTFANGDWEGNFWKDIPAMRINEIMGGDPGHKPEVEAKISYNAEAIYVIFRVKDRYVRAVASHYQGSVYKDSCVEFFFTPGEDTSMGYFNLEMNCGGTALFHFQKIPRKDPVPVSEEDFRNIEIYHTLPVMVDPEITEQVTWIVSYRIPYEILKNYCDVTMPASGIRWKANLYKCGDDTSHPHWLTWSVVDRPKPDFHRPEYFGVLQFR